MTRIDLHPEELLDRAESGLASKEERFRLEAHLASCRACSFEHALIVDCKRSTAPRPDDEIVVDRIRASVARALSQRSQPAGLRARQRGIRVRALLAFAATVFLTTVVAATMILRERHRLAEERVEAARESERSKSHATLVRESAEERAVTDKPVVAPVQAAVDAEESPAVPRAQRSLSSAEHSRATDLTAAELFAHANQLRRQDEVGNALRAYRELARSFPGSAEELVSRVSLGRLLLDRVGDAAGALAEFNSYLANSSQGTLGEEALVGRALALGRLGRVAEERSTWGTLLASHPGSTYAARARARIEQLSTR